MQRLNLGGKALTNLLKETVSYRSLNMAEEAYLMETVKDALCWVSQVRARRGKGGGRGMGGSRPGTGGRVGGGQGPVKGRLVTRDVTHACSTAVAPVPPHQRPTPDAARRPPAAPNPARPGLPRT